jgi:short-subunit dehydrogenase
VTALITGASSGLGATFARHLSQRGVDLIVVARRQDRLADLAAKLQTEDRIRCEILAADLATDEGVARVVERIASQEPLDYLINNAGFGTRGLFFDGDVAPQETMHRLHVLATLALTHAALRKMVARGQGSIINVASVAGFALSAGSTSYNATKHWMNVFTEGLHLELQLKNSPVKVQSLCPGYTYSEFHDVAGMDRKLIPLSLWLDADYVVAESLRALDKGELFVVPGARYRWFVRLFPHLPRWVRHRVAIKAGRRMKRI